MIVDENQQEQEKTMNNQNIEEKQSIRGHEYDERYHGAYMRNTKSK